MKKLHELQSVSIKNLDVYGTLHDGKEIMLNNFQVISASIKHITLDHTVSFYNLVNQNLSQLPDLKLLYQTISNGRKLNKEKMRGEYERIVNQYSMDEVDTVLKEVKYLAVHTKLVLMPSHLNYSKGKK
ncbi:hypothetical protein DDQ68_04640 [Hymenobacter nivis]|uniref:Uncharacterized protein n=2 Tax=Hymenobacter nivis TaxID=1850093 RepID=A0A2Z3GRW1_9BACT|nr:hypothetical protein DDQ68_04640 [Hymenobacter nivis]